MLSSTLFVLASLASAAPAQDAAWPRWRGPSGDGISLERDWNPAGREEPLWRADVGLGYSNVVIADGRLYTVGHDAEAQEDRIVCLDLASGKERWRFAFPSDTMANYHGGGALGTPTLDRDLLFAVGRRGRVHCLDAASGKLRWERDYSQELEVTVPEYGFAPAPVVVGDVVYLALGPTLAAVARADGELQWRKDDLGASGYATPALFEHLGKTCLAAFAGVGLVVLDAASGEERYRFALEGDQGVTVNATTPIVDGGRVFVSSGYGAGAALLWLGDEHEPDVVWQNKLMRNKVGTSVLWQGHVYGFDESILKCLRLEDGGEQWRARGLGMGAIGLAGGRLLILSSRGELVVAEAAPDAFHELSRKKVLDGGVYWTAPVLLDGRIYCRNSLGDLVCRDHRNTTEKP
jgi:outer membrane protein assembly factor BamB